MSAKPTDGEWSFDPDEMTVVSEGSAVIAKVMDVDDFPCLDQDDADALTHEECIANGQLLGAALEMLELLRDLTRHHPSGRMGRRIAVAIARAEGRS